MSSLRPEDTRLLERIFGMSGGYVLDFTDRSFAAFFRQAVSIDIMAGKYAGRGTSKANRLRAFWENEPDPVVGQALEEMLQYCGELDLDGKQSDPRLLARAQSIVSRLLKGERATSPDEDSSDERFLKQDFRNINFSKLPVAPEIAVILGQRMEKALRVHKSNAPLATIFMCGSILEGFLLGSALRDPKAFNAASRSPKDNRGKVKEFRDWTLTNYIDVAHELEILNTDVKKFSHVLREFRNHIHPYEQQASGFMPDGHTAKICLQVLRAAIAGVAGDRT